MKSILLSLIFALCLCNISAQDDYHNNLNTYLQANYNLPAPEWVFFDTEAAILGGATAYGSTNSMATIPGEEFSQAANLIIAQAGANPWDAGWSIRNKVAISTGDIMLASFYIRSVGGEGSVNFFVENVTDFFKEVYLTLPVTEEWTRYFVPFSSQNTYDVNESGWGFHLASQAQTIQVGGFTAINYNNSTTIDQLPDEVNNDQYGGYESDAPWRAEAATRINNLRKAELTVNVTTSAGTPVDDAAIQVTMLQHEYGFGTAVNAARIAGNNSYNATYEDKIVNLDGEGHGFSSVVFENDLKWPAWEEEWLVNKPELVDAVQWLRNNNLKIRGHTLVWPGADNLPDDVAADLTNIPFVKSRIDEHIETVFNYPGIAGEIEEWDVLNEIITNTSMQNAFSGQSGYPTGREIYPEIFDKATEVDPNVGLWLNDYITISLNQSAGSSQYDNLKAYTQEIMDAGAEVEGIGFQGHIGGFPTGIPDVLNTLDDFSTSFGLKTKITEFDMPASVSEELAAQYLRDFVTAVFSHPSSDGFLFWSFWDGATWQNPGSNLYRNDWSETPAHAAFVDLLFNEWWTDKEFESQPDGIASDEVFKGLYEISYECDGVIVRDTITILEAMTYDISCDNIGIVGTNEALRLSIDIFPNPANEYIHVSRKENTAAHIRLFNSSGKILLETQSSDYDIQLDVSDFHGFFFLKYSSKEGVFTEKIVIE